MNKDFLKKIEEDVQKVRRVNRHKHPEYWAPQITERDLTLIQKWHCGEEDVSEKPFNWMSDDRFLWIPMQFINKGGIVQILLRYLGTKTVPHMFEIMNASRSMLVFDDGFPLPLIDYTNFHYNSENKCLSVERRALGQNMPKKFTVDISRSDGIRNGNVAIYVSSL
ncbi:MAG: hypothetical protein IPN70_05430 [Candidatus Moraniibacteriota bacterium]|nr:MAG: hypothetical protein IPN70_05430 [Candidatus Moranbacteria bacterium]